MNRKSRLSTAVASIVAAFVLCAPASGTSAFSVHGCFGDHMVLQRDKPVRISGTASPGTEVRGSFRGASVAVEAGQDGEWTLEFPAGSAGGPFELVIDARSAVIFHDVMVGEVWFCSGQSNMEYPVWHPGQFWGLPDGEAVAADGDAGIRLFLTPHAVAPDGPCDEPPGRPVWRLGSDPAAVKPFSAVAWFFGRELRRRLGLWIEIAQGDDAAKHIVKADGSMDDDLFVLLQLVYVYMELAGYYAESTSNTILAGARKHILRTLVAALKKEGK